MCVRRTLGRSGCTVHLMRHGASKSRADRLIGRDMRLRWVGGSRIARQRCMGNCHLLPALSSYGGGAAETSNPCPVHAPPASCAFSRHRHIWKTAGRAWSSLLVQTLLIAVLNASRACSVCSVRGGQHTLYPFSKSRWGRRRSCREPARWSWPSSGPPAPAKRSAPSPRPRVHVSMPASKRKEACSAMRLHIGMQGTPPVR